MTLSAVCSLFVILFMFIRLSSNPQISLKLQFLAFLIRDLAREFGRHSRAVGRTAARTVQPSGDLFSVLGLARELSRCKNLGKQIRYFPSTDRYLVILLKFASFPAIEIRLAERSSRKILNSLSTKFPFLIICLFCSCCLF